MRAASCWLLPWCAGCHRRRRARGLRLPPCRRSWSSALPVRSPASYRKLSRQAMYALTRPLFLLAFLFVAKLIGLICDCSSARETTVGASPRGASNSTRRQAGPLGGERIRVAGAARPARSSAREPAVGASPRGASSSTRRRAGPPGGEQRRAAPRGWRGAPRRVSHSARPARSSVAGEQLPAGEGLRGGEQLRVEP